MIALVRRRQEMPVRKQDDDDFQNNGIKNFKIKGRREIEDRSFHEVTKQ